MNAIHVETRITNNVSEGEREFRSQMLAEAHAALKKRYAGPDGWRKKATDEAVVGELLRDDEARRDLAERTRRVEQALRTVWA